MYKHTLAIISLFVANWVYAGGFQVSLQGVRQQGMANAGAATLQGASNLFHNPGSIAFLEKKIQAELGASLVYAKTAYFNPDQNYEAFTNSPLSAPFYAYASSQLKPWLAVGVGVYTPFGSNLAWEKSWKGRFLIQDIELNTVFVQPTVAIRIAKKIGLGFGVNVASGALTLERDIPVNAQNGNRSFSTLSGDAQGVGYTAGLFWKINEKFNLAFNYRSIVRFELDDGKAIFNVPNELRAEFPRNNTFSTQLNTPSSFAVALAAKVSKRILLSAEVNFVQWSSYEELAVDFRTNTNSLKDFVEPRNYEDAYTIRLGMEYQESCCVTLRAGLAFDKTPVNKVFYSPETPDSDKLALSTGFTYDFDDRWSINGAYTFVLGSEVEGKYAPANFEGVYKSLGHVVGAGLTLKF